HRARGQQHPKPGERRAPVGATPVRTVSAPTPLCRGRRWSLNDIVSQTSGHTHRMPLVSRMDGRGARLQYEIVRRPRNTVFVWTVIHHRMHAGEIVERWRRGNRPLERGRIPRIDRGGSALLDAPEQVDKEDDLRGCGEISRPAHE